MRLINVGARKEITIKGDLSKLKIVFDRNNSMNVVINETQTFLEMSDNERKIREEIPKQGRTWILRENGPRARAKRSTLPRKMVRRYATAVQRSGLHKHS